MTTTDIRWIEAEYLWNEEDRAKKRSVNITFIIDVEALESRIAKLGIEARISSSSQTAHSFSAPVPSMKIKSIDDHPPLTRATTFVIGHLAKATNLKPTKV